MGFSFKFLPVAEENIEEATDYYGEISVKVLKNFNKQLDLAISRILINPYFQKRYKEVRALPLRKFPYIIFYEVDERKNHLHPFGFLHASESEKISIKNLIIKSNKSKNGRNS